GAVRPGGLLGASLKEGDGEAWSTHGSVTAPRRFVYWREGPLRAALEGSGWQVRDLTVEVSPFNDQPWLLVQAGRR
ncbi:hypothetical protein P5E74_14345, partial [Clostridium perfringens]|nr:hypothetical protein [Clostridium perfringens]